MLICTETATQLHRDTPKSNAEAIEHVYYEYHGWSDEGNDVADLSFLPHGFMEVTIK